jgi:hypothetical protein
MHKVLKTMTHRVEEKDAPNIVLLEIIVAFAVRFNACRVFRLRCFIFSLKAFVYVDSFVYFLCTWVVPLCTFIYIDITYQKMISGDLTWH